MCGEDMDCYGDCFDTLNGWDYYKCMNNRCYRGTSMNTGMRCEMRNSCDAADMSNGDEWCVEPYVGAGFVYLYEKCPVSALRFVFVLLQKGHLRCFHPLSFAVW